MAARTKCDSAEVAIMISYTWIKFIEAEVAGDICLFPILAIFARQEVVSFELDHIVIIEAFPIGFP